MLIMACKYVYTPAYWSIYLFANAFPLIIFTNIIDIDYWTDLSVQNRLTVEVTSYWKLDPEIGIVS